MFSHPVIVKTRLVVGSHPIVWSLALLPDDDVKQDPVVCGAEFRVEFLAKSPRTA